MPAVIVVVAAYAASTAVVGMIGAGIIGSIIVGAIVGAVVGGLTAAVMGEDVMDGFKAGALTGAFAGGMSAYNQGATAWEGAAPDQVSTGMATGDISGTEAVGTTGENVIANGGDLAAGEEMLGAANTTPADGGMVTPSGGATAGDSVATAGTDVATAGTDVATAGGNVAKAGSDVASRVKLLEDAAVAKEGMLTMSDKIALGGSVLQGYGEMEAAKAEAEAAKDIDEANSPKMQAGVDPTKATFTLGDAGPTRVRTVQPNVIRDVSPRRRAGLVNQG